MKYTFLLPAYKTTFFKDSLESILNQTYPDFNVIVSDDCSPEDLRSVVDQFCDSRVEYRRNEKNIGAARLVDHWNLLLGLTDAEYIIMASDDDIYDSHYLEELDKMTYIFPEVNVFRPRIRCIDAEGKEFWREKVIFGEEIISRREYLNCFAKETLASGIPQYLFKRESLLSIGGFVNLPMAWFSDDATVALLADKGICFCPQCLFSFRISANSISSANVLKKADWSCKFKASSMYAEIIQGLLDDSTDKDLMESLYTRARRISIKMLNQAPVGTFLQMMSFIRKLGAPLYPFVWRARRYVGRFIHLRSKIV